MKLQENAVKIIELIKSRRGIEAKQICEVLGLTIGQFTNAQPYIKKECYRETKRWHMIVVEEVPPRIRKSPTATIIYNMMPVSQMGLKERMGMHKDAIWRALKLLREYNLIHITGYESNNTTIYPKFTKGRGIDAKRPDSKALANARSNKYKAKNIEVVREKHKAYRVRNKELLKFKQMARYWAKADEINAKAREKARIKREFVTVLTPPPMTQWRTALPWEARV